MADHEPTIEQPATRAGTAPANGASGAGTGTKAGAAVAAPLPPPGAAHGEQHYLDDDEEWVSQAPKGLRIPASIGVLLLLLFAVCGLWGGSVLQKHRDKSKVSTTAAAAAGGGAARRAAAAAAGGGNGAAGTGTGTGGFGGGGAGATTGIVTDITGSTVSITDANGNLVTINLSPSSVITKTATATAADLKLGQTIVVRGSKAPDGSTSASSVIISPAATGTGPPGTAGTPTAGATGGGG